MSDVKNLLTFLFGLRRHVDRRSYFVTGVLLMVLKLGVDLLILHAAIGRPWRLIEFLSLARLSYDDPMWALQMLMVWALPFAWIGLSMSTRRAIDAGLSPWIGLLFCIPLLNFLVVFVVALAGRLLVDLDEPLDPRHSHARLEPHQGRDRVRADPFPRSAMRGPLPSQGGWAGRGLEAPPPRKPPAAISS